MARLPLRSPSSASRFALAAVCCGALATACGGSVVATHDGGTQVVPVSLAIAPGTLALQVGASQPLALSAVLSDGSSQAVSSAAWSSSADAVASVSQTGLVTANGAGSAIVSVVALGLTAALDVTVTEPAADAGPGPSTLVSVALNASGSTHVAPGGTLALTLTGSFSAGAPRDLTAQATWTTDAPSALSVASGVVTGLADGAGHVTATVTVDGVTKQAGIAVSCGLSTAGAIFTSGVFAPDVTFTAASGNTAQSALDSSVTDPAGSASLRIDFGAGSSGGDFLASAPRDASGFDSLVFWAKASGPLSIDALGFGDASGANPDDVSAALALTTTWTQYVLPFPQPGRLDSLTRLAGFSDASNHAGSIWLADVELANRGAAALGVVQPSFVTTSLSLAAGLTQGLTARDLKLHWSNSGAPIDETASLAYFTFSSSAPAVATIDSAGLISAIAAGSASLSAALGAAQGTNALALTVTAPGYDPGAGWTLTWSDEFNGAALDTNTWNYDLGAGGWGNDESEYYTQDNAQVAGGFLTITAKIESMGDAPYTSARIQTAQKKTFQRGKLSMRAKLPYSQAMWPAFWLLGADSSSQGGIYGGDVSWPSCGEIDIMEMIGGLADGSGDYTTHGTLHYLAQSGRDPGPSYAYRLPARLSDDFHVYEVIWTHHSFTFSIDGVAYGTKIITSDMTALEQPMFMLLNLAIGGAWGGWVSSICPGSTESGMCTVFPQTYVIDYVREYTNASITDTGAEGLASVWHLVNTPSTGTPAGETLQSAAGSVSGFQPLKTLTAPAAWYSPALTGKFEAGAWQLNLFTTSPGASAVVEADLYVTAADGTGPTKLGGAQLDVNATGGGNHISSFGFVGIPEVDLANQRLEIVLSPVSGASAQMVYNGNDFDTALSAPWSPGN